MGHEKFSPSFAAADWQKSTNCTGDKSSFLSMPQHRSQYAKVYTRPCQAQDSEGDQGCPQWGEAAAGLRSDHRTGRGSGRRTADGGWRRPLELLLAVAAGWVRPRLAQNTCRPTQAPGLQPLLAHCSHTGSPGLFRDTCPCLPSYRRGDHFVNRASSVRTSNILLHPRSHLWS